MNKKGLYVLMGIVILIILLTLILIFSKIMKKEEFTVNNYEISLDNNVSKDSFKELGPIEDKDSDSVSPYKFSIRNTDSEDSSYELLLEDIVDNKKDKDILTRDYLHYELKLNNLVIKTGSLSDIKNNILDTRDIAQDSTNKYALKIWISSTAKNKDWMDKYYHYNISVQPVSS